VTAVGEPRRFPVENTKAAFVVKDSGGQKLSYVYYDLRD
jgi:hypothetical protein